MPTSKEFIATRGLEEEVSARAAALRVAAAAEPASAPVALTIPAYNVADLPSAFANPNAIVRVKDNPQGTAQSNGATWISDVDGSDLGPGNG